MWNNCLFCNLALADEYTYMYKQTTHLEVVCSVDWLRVAGSLSTLGVAGSLSWMDIRNMVYD